jgi:hypothetical protein
MSKLMKLPQCDREQEVVDALCSGRWASEWGEEIRQHAAVCGVCAEVALAAQEFQREAELARVELQQPGAGLPSAGLVWWKAQLAARRAAEQRATEPIMLVERAAYALGTLAALGLGVWQWPRIAGWLHGTETAASLPRFAAMPDYSSSGAWLHRLAQAWTGQTPTYLLAASAAAFLALMVFAVYVVWQED